MSHFKPHPILFMNKICLILNYKPETISEHNYNIITGTIMIICILTCYHRI